MMMADASIESRWSPDRKVLLAIPAVLAVALLVLPFVSRDAGGSLVTQTVVALLLVLGVIDVLTLKVPNIVVYPSIAFVLAATAIIDSALLDEAFLGGGATLGVMFVLALIGRGQMGMGDVKFACLIGCAMGWKLGLASLVLGFAIGAAAAIVILILRLRGRKDSVPLTPFLAVGALVFILLTGTLVS